MVLDTTAQVIKSAPPAEWRAGVSADFGLDSSIAFLNHGSFGARPRKVLEAQDRRRAEFEARPIEWLDRRRDRMIADAKQAVGRFLGMAPRDFGFVTNATGAINAVLRSLQFKPGDELLTTNHVYNAVRLSMQYVAQRAGANYIEVAVPLPVKSPDEILQSIVGRFNDRTRFVLIDHISSPTAIVFPIKRLIDACNSRGIDVMIDGAHAPGMIPLDVEGLGAAYYAGNLHKWLCAPVGAAFLWARPNRQSGIHPTTISHFLDEGFAEEFNWQGTRDITPWLCVQEALAYFDELGWERVMAHNHQMAVWVQQLLCERWDVPPASPLDGSMIGSMATVPLPHQETLRRKFGDFKKLMAALYDAHRIEVPVVDWMDRWWVRPCCQVYNVPEHYERLAEAALELAT